VPDEPTAVHEIALNAPGASDAQCSRFYDYCPRAGTVVIAAFLRPEPRLSFALSVPDEIFV
jgi:hypothetical protein